MGGDGGCDPLDTGGSWEGREGLEGREVAAGRAPGVFGADSVGLSGELCRRRVSRRNKEPRKPKMTMHPPSSSPAAKDTTAAKCIGTNLQIQIPLNVLQSSLPILHMDLLTVDDCCINPTIGR